MTSVLTQALYVSSYSLGFVSFKGDIAANLLQDEIAKEKQVFDVEQQHKKPATRLQAQEMLFKRQFLTDSVHQDDIGHIYPVTTCF